jgi:hypothetical protein
MLGVTVPAHRDHPRYHVVVRVTVVPTLQHSPSQRAGMRRMISTAGPSLLHPASTQQIVWLVPAGVYAQFAMSTLPDSSISFDRDR